MKSFLKYYFGLAVLIIFFLVCGGKEYDFINASKTGAAVSDYLQTQHPNVKVLVINAKNGLITLSLENGKVAVFDKKGKYMQEINKEIDSVACR